MQAQALRLGAHLPAVGFAVHGSLGIAASSCHPKIFCFAKLDLFYVLLRVSIWL